MTDAERISAPHSAQQYLQVIHEMLAAPEVSDKIRSSAAYQELLELESEYGSRCVQMAILLRSAELAAGEPK